MKMLNLLLDYESTNIFFVYSRYEGLILRLYSRIYDRF